MAEALGAVDAAAISRIAGALVARDGAAVLAELEALHARGLEMKRVAEELVRHLRNVVVTKLVPASPLDLPDAELAEVRAQAAAADAAQLTRLFDLVQRAVVDVKLSEQPRYALEVALLEGVFLAPGRAGVRAPRARRGARARRAPPAALAPDRRRRTRAADRGDGAGEGGHADHEPDPDRGLDRDGDRDLDRDRDPDRRRRDRDDRDRRPRPRPIPASAGAAPSPRSRR